ncbi:MAG: M20/M25/M40 family metallo-hydrolase [Verrucomicrobiota bacterium]
MNEGKVIRFLVIGLPAGLLLMGILAMVGSHLRKTRLPTDPNESIRLEAALLKQRPVSKADLERDLLTLTETIGERNVVERDQLEAAAIWIHSTLGGRNLGYTVQPEIYEVEMEGGERFEVRNLFADLPGKKRRKEIVVVGAHYDTIRHSPGANDNGTGVVAMLAIARAMTGEQQDRTVRFAAFVNEEPPFFQGGSMGSMVHARGCLERGENIVAMISLETIGYFTDEPDSQELPAGLGAGFPEVGNFLALISNLDSQFLVDSAATSFASASDLPLFAGAFPESVDGVGWSDHWSFWRVGFPAMMATDMAPFRYPHYHLPSDTIDKIDFDRFESAVRGLEAVVREWAN